MNNTTSSDGKKKKGANSGKDAKKKTKRSSRSSTQAIEVSISVKVSRIITSINYEYFLNILAIVQFFDIAFTEQIYQSYPHSVDYWILS
jgi:hypothetical protein